MQRGTPETIYSNNGFSGIFKSDFFKHGYRGRKRRTVFNVFVGVYAGGEARAEENKKGGGEVTFSRKPRKILGRGGGVDQCCFE